MYIWLFSSIINYQLYIPSQQYIQQYIQLPFRSEYTAVYLTTLLNKSENSTLQLSIFCEKVLDKKYLLMFADIQQRIRRNSTNLSRLMSELCSFRSLKLYSLTFAIAHAQMKIVMLIKIGHNCFA